MRFHHNKYPDIVLFNKAKILAKIKDMGRDTSEFEEEANLLDGKQGRYNGWMDLTQDLMLYDFVGENGKTYGVPAFLFDESDGREE
jgi:hypothetical protein